MSIQESLPLLNFFRANIPSNIQAIQSNVHHNEIFKIALNDFAIRMSKNYSFNHKGHPISILRRNFDDDFSQNTIEKIVLLFSSLEFVANEHHHQNILNIFNKLTIELLDTKHHFEVISQCLKLLLNHPHTNLKELSFQRNFSHYFSENFAHPAFDSIKPVHKLITLVQIVNFKEQFVSPFFRSENGIQALTNIVNQVSDNDLFELLELNHYLETKKTPIILFNYLHDFYHSCGKEIPPSICKLFLKKYEKTISYQTEETNLSKSAIFFPYNTMFHHSETHSSEHINEHLKIVLKKMEEFNSDSDYFSNPTSLEDSLTPFLPEFKILLNAFKINPDRDANFQSCFFTSIYFHSLSTSNIEKTSLKTLLTELIRHGDLDFLNILENYFVHQKDMTYSKNLSKVPLYFLDETTKYLIVQTIYDKIMPSSTKKHVSINKF